MFKRWFSSKANSNAVTAMWQLRAEGLHFPITLADDESHWGLTAYLEQLFDEDFVSAFADGWLLPWDSIYSLLNLADHQNSLPLLQLPEMSTLVPVLASQGGLADADFTVYIADWTDKDPGQSYACESTGAVLRVSDQNWLVSEDTWQLIKAVSDLYIEQQRKSGEVTNQLGWAKVRKFAKRAGARLDNFLEKTVVIRPEKLRLQPTKTVVGDTSVIELGVKFDDEPEGFASSFDRLQQVQDNYRIPAADGSLTHVVIEPEVKSVLQQVRSLPGRRIAGDAALSMLRNPQNFFGEEASAAIDFEALEQDLEHAGIDFHRFIVNPNLSADGQRIESVSLFLLPTGTAGENIEFTFDNPAQFAPFVNELSVKLAAGMPAGLWQGYELELADFTIEQLAHHQRLLADWQKQVNGEMLGTIFDLSQYGERVIGIGEQQEIVSPYLDKATGQHWLPEQLIENFAIPDLLAQLDTEDTGQLQALQQLVDESLANGDETVSLPQLPEPVPTQLAKQMLDSIAKKLSKQATEHSDDAVSGPEAVLQLEQNIDELTYAQARDVALLKAKTAAMQSTDLLRPEVILREHQQQGIAWLQHLFNLSPQAVSGCLLADDMGLGKTIQLLNFVVWYLERYPEGEPVLITAPVSLLDNWQAELNKFFYADTLPLVKLYGKALAAVKFSKHEIPAEIKAQGINNLLKPNWLGEARIVLTTYDTLRDYEISFSRQKWGIVIGDEAQKLKNPKAGVTRAFKGIASRARFTVACTGTPVENTLADLWSLFDIIQPGLLGALNVFGRDYLKPIEVSDVRDIERLEKLRKIIEPQTLRRTKEEVAKDLPAKIVDSSCRKLAMHAKQVMLYNGAITDYQQLQDAKKQIDASSNNMLTLLTKLRMICADPFVVTRNPDYRAYSPKMQWLMQQLDQIAARGEKAIVFTEFLDMQRELKQAIKQRFNFDADIINGSTSTDSNSANNRQRKIDRFQARPGFGVIILSTTAVGFGVNVQAANHVIHFTRCWNPAKEDQATDRAYRIGQEKDVYVYYPTVHHPQFASFEATLDELLAKRRSLARDMLHAQTDITTEDFSSILKQ